MVRGRRAGEARGRGAAEGRGGLIVYGDAARHLDARDAAEGVAEALRRIASAPAGVARHAAIVGALIEAGALATAVADAAFEERGEDAPSGAVDAAMGPVLRLATAMRASWDGRAPDLPSGLGDLRSSLPAGILRLNRAEGFAHYALYPEAYLSPASSLAPRSRVIGIRSIGATLGAVVAATASGELLTVRPVGHPFRRTLALSDAAADRLAGGADHVAVVDEGPGLSGSSFGAVLDALEARGIAEDRIVVLPSHDGAPGSRADPRHRSRWNRLRRLPATDATRLLVRSGRLAAWASDLLGPAVAPLEDLSGGAWRRLRFADERRWPPVHPGQERLKFLHRTRDAAWLLKFVGLGRHGEAQVARARALGEAGFSPEVGGFLHGFVAERWHEDARPLDPARADRGRLIAHLSHYLGWRARHLPAGQEPGADVEALWRMARHNTALAVGEDIAVRLDRWKRGLPDLARLSRPVWTDGRLHVWEWQETPLGLLKTDAVDHAAAHDLIGPQDVAWDVAGAAAEFGLTAEETEALRAGVSDAAGRVVEPSLLAFLMPCYLAFQLGRETMAAEAAGDAARCRAASGRYADALRRVLDA